MYNPKYDSSAASFNTKYNSNKNTFDPFRSTSNEIVFNDKYPEYTGNYTVEAKVDGQILKTKDTIMKDDVVVKPISVVKTSNTAGGNTVIIGV